MSCPLWAYWVTLAMFLIAPLFSLVAIVTVFLMFEVLQLRQLKAPWSDVRSGMFGTVAEWAAKRALSFPGGHDRAWKPSLLVPVARQWRYGAAIVFSPRLPDPMARSISWAATGKTSATY